VEHDQQLHGPYTMLDVVKLNAKLLHLETRLWMGVVLEYDGCARFTIDNITIVTQP
jgi:hypothetical protein